jgi:mRNA interferase HigB
VRIVTEAFLKRTSAKFPEAAGWLKNFQKHCQAAHWKNIVELRYAYPHADLVTVASGRSVIVLNVSGNKYRMLIAAHFNRQTIYTLRFMTHAEYSKNNWKYDL